MHSSRTTHSIKQTQRGAVFIIMLVILVMGVAAILVTSLSKVALHTERDRTSSDLLSQAKDVVIGYALNGTGGAQRPGDLLYPDVLSETPPNYDGNTEGGCLNSLQANGLPPISSGASMRCLGRLPWKVFNMPITSPSENDSTGFMPWYAISANMVDTGITPFNSELLSSAPHPWLTVRDMKGNVLSNRVAFIIFAPGAALPGQSRPSSPLGGANQYLDSISVPATCAAPCVPGTYNNFDMDDDFIMGDEHRWIDDPANPGRQIEDSSYHFNDKLLYVTIDDLMPLIEKRIAREVKSCLDVYAADSTNTSHRYPWAASATDSTPYPNRPGTYTVRFGRISDIPNNSTTSGSTPPTGTLLSLIQAVQTALSNYIANPTAGNLGILNNNGDTLKDYSGSTPAAVAAGITADNCTGMSCTTTLQNQLSTAMGNGTPDPSMPSTWTTTACTSFFTSPGSYWADWRDLVFYQVADGYQPGGGTFTPLHIAGSGNPVVDSNTYRAAVVVSGKRLGSQSRPAYMNPPNDYLANTITEFSTDPAFVPNAHNDTAPATTFITYKTSDPYYQSVNDLVLCLDGKNNCQ